LETPAPVYDEGAVTAFPAGIAQTHQESAMRIQPHSTAAATPPAATSKSSRSPHAPAMKAAAPAAAAAPAKAAVPAAAAAPATKVATEAKAAEAAAKPETYGGAGSLLDAHA
jgi:two-component system chemotaxis sensor kinase CheA